ncbi:MAG: amidohydrolase [Nocardiopsaceae bacterium]|nr:amidohydrolase [Nocardiopsaceae bacterium]
MTIRGADQPPLRTAEVVLVNGKIRTPAHPSGFVRAMAIGGGIIRALGDDEDIRPLTGRRTRVVDLRGRLAIPAFGDAHIHPVQGGLDGKRCTLLGARSGPECLNEIAVYSASLPAGAWVLGGGWSPTAFPSGAPAAGDLDKATGRRPAFLTSRDRHSAWVNTAALHAAGITGRTPDPPDGRIERDPSGAPSGTLHAGAVRLVADQVPAPTRAELTDALMSAQKFLHSVGITSVQDACVGEAGEIGIPDTFGTYLQAASDRKLTMRVTGALWWDRNRGLDQIDRLLARRAAAEGSGYFRATTVKLMLDGVCETLTAAMSSPYLDGHGRVTSHYGNLFIDPAELVEAANRLSDHGFQLHFHAVGDRAVTAALDAVESLPRPARDAARHHIAHLRFVRPEDLERFSRAGVVATFQPLWACDDERNHELTVPFVGPQRAAWQYRIGGVFRRAGRVAFGSDWPVSSPNPLQEMHVAVNRMLSTRLGRPGAPETSRPLLLAEAIPVDAALHAFTAGVAHVNHEDHVAGTLRPGMLADVVVLDRDIYAVPPSTIGDTSVAMTIASGQVVHGDE